MRILIDTTSMMPRVNGGGESYARGLVSGLEQIDQENIYGIVVSRQNREMFDHLRAPNFTLLEAQADTFRRRRRFLYQQLRLPFLAAWWHADLALFPANMIPLMLPLLRIPSIVTIHDFSPAFYRDELPGYIPEWENWVRRIMATYAARHATKVITVSDFSRREVVLHTGIESRKITVVYSGCDGGDDTEIDDSQVLEKYGIRKPYVVLVGSTNKHKNTDLFVEAFAHAKRKYSLPHTVVLAGIKGNGHPDLMEATESAKAGGFVSFVGYVEAEHLSSVYRNADLFAMPSLYEGFGFPVVEAMRLGVPALISRTASLPEVGGDAAWYMDPRDAASISSEIGTLLTSPQLREEMRTRGHIQAAKFRWKQAAAETLEVCQRAAGRRSTADGAQPSVSVTQESQEE